MAPSAATAAPITGYSQRRGKVRDATFMVLHLDSSLVPNQPTTDPDTFSQAWDESLLTPSAADVQFFTPPSSVKADHPQPRILLDVRSFVEGYKVPSCDGAVA